MLRKLHALMYLFPQSSALMSMMQNFILAYPYLFVGAMYSDHSLRPAWHHLFPPVIYRLRVCQHRLPGAPLTQISF